VLQEEKDHDKEKKRGTGEEGRHHDQAKKAGNAEYWEALIQAKKEGQQERIRRARYLRDRKERGTPHIKKQILTGGEGGLI